MIGGGRAGGHLRLRARRSAERAAPHRPDERDGPLRGRRSSASRWTPTRGIYFLESDVNELAQAKGANVAGLQVVFSDYGIQFDDIDVFYLAGGFGRHLKMAASKRIGLIPNLPDDKIVQVGNAAIEGATHRAALARAGARSSKRW